MVMSLEPLYLLSDVPGDVALAVAGAYGVTAIAVILALWRQHLLDVSRGQSNIERMAESSHATADAMANLTRAIEGKLPDAYRHSS